MGVTVEEWAATWATEIAHTLRPETGSLYTGILRRVILPRLGTRPLRELTQQEIRQFLVAELSAGRGRAYTQRVLYVLSSMCNAAIDAGLLDNNPAHGAGRRLFRRLGESGPRKAFTQAERDLLLSRADVEAPQLADYYYTLSRSGLRPGEALGLTWSEIHWQRQQIWVGQSWGRHGLSQTTKAGGGRWVDLSETLQERLEERQRHDGHGRWIFESPSGPWPYSLGQAERVLRQLLRVTELPSHFRVHSFRHTWATLLLERGVPEVYVQRQLGHASISMTVDLYGRSARVSDPRYLERLEETPRRHGPLRSHPGGRAEHPNSGEREPSGSPIGGKNFGA
jgi:integrase